MSRELKECRLRIKNEQTIWNNFIKKIQLCQTRIQIQRDIELTGIHIIIFRLPI
nr:MAG TPA: hypothetical protein [Caudoviricetes sp.]